MSSPQAEVIPANLAIRAVGRPSSCPWQVIRQAGGVTNLKAQSSAVGTHARNTKTDLWEVDPMRDQVVDAMLNPDIHSLIQKIVMTALSITNSCPPNASLLPNIRMELLMLMEWTGMTIFRIYLDPMK